MGKKNRKKEKNSKKLLRIVTLIFGLGFAGSMLALSLGGVFSQTNTHNANYDDSDAPSAEEQIQLQVRGYEKVLQREPSNLTALAGLTQIYLQTGNKEKSILTLEKLVKYYPEQSQYAQVLEEIKQQDADKPVEPKQKAPETK